MGIIAYQRFFPVGREFDFSKFMQSLDDQDFHPFILFTEKISDWQYRCYFKHVNASLPLVPGQRRGNIADEILLREFIIEGLQDDIRIIATISPTALVLIGLFVVIFVGIAILVHSIFALLLAVFVVSSQVLKYRWDVKRFNRIGEIANQSPNE